MAEQLENLVAELEASEPPAVNETPEDESVVAWKISYSTYRA